jgi:CBS domain-containing protein
MRQTRARDVMTPDPACCSPHATLDEVARLMLQYNCGEIPVIAASDEVVGVITDRDIVCRVVAQGKNPQGHTADSCMTPRVVTAFIDDSIDDVVAAMEKHQIRRVPVLDESGRCAGIIAQADVARQATANTVAELLRRLSRE